MSADIIHLFPPRKAERSIAGRREQWIFEADRQMLRSAWLWPVGAPGWVGDGWWKYIEATCPIDELEPSAADWAELWLSFVEAWLRHQPEFKQLQEIVS